MSGGSAVAASMCLLAGLAGSVQVAVMGRFGERIGIVQALAFSTLLTATIAGVALLVLRRSAAGYADGLHSPPWLWTGAAMSALIVFSLTLAAPRIGTAATVGLMISGNLAMAAVVDRLGLFGLEQIPLSWPRLLGIALLAVGAALSLQRG